MKISTYLPLLTINVLIFWKKLIRVEIQNEVENIKVEGHNTGTHGNCADLQLLLFPDLKALLFKDHAKQKRIKYNDPMKWYYFRKQLHPKYACQLNKLLLTFLVSAQGSCLHSSQMFRCHLGVKLGRTRFSVWGSCI